MSITGTGTVTSTTSTTTNTTNESSSSLDKNAFLRLMCTQLQNQDPLSPMQDTEYISQMASFTSLEQMQNLNTSFTKLASSITDDLLPILTLQQAGNAVGHTATYNNPDTTSKDTVLTGTIDSVCLKNGKAVYTISGKQISQDDVLSIGRAADGADTQLLEDILDQLKQLNEFTGQVEGEQVG